VVLRYAMATKAIVQFTDVKKRRSLLIYLNVLIINEDKALRTSVHLASLVLMDIYPLIHSFTSDVVNTFFVETEAANAK
jgi:hypothetical protein